VRVEIWSDVVCPWCYIGKRRFETARHRFEAQFDHRLDVEYRAFMLDPTAPAVGVPVRQAYEKKFGGPEAAQQIIARVTEQAAGEGLTFNMDRALRANTLPAHRLLVLAHREGVQSALKERLMAAYFTDGLDIGDAEVLLDTAAAAGLDRDQAGAWLADDGGADEVAESLLFAADNGIASVPTFVLDRRVALPGAQDPDTIVRVLTRLAERDGPQLLG
jgi:predicted DsbA family dithiol-disulfide isomerase